MTTRWWVSAAAAGLLLVAGCASDAEPGDDEEAPVHQGYVVADQDLLIDVANGVPTPISVDDLR